MVNTKRKLKSPVKKDTLSQKLNTSNSCEDHAEASSEYNNVSVNGKLEFRIFCPFVLEPPTLCSSFGYERYHSHLIFFSNCQLNITLTGTLNRTLSSTLESILNRTLYIILNRTPKSMVDWSYS